MVRFVNNPAFGKALTWATGLAIVLMVMRFAWLVQADHLVFETDPLALLPHMLETPLVEEIDRRASAEIKSHIVTVIQGEDTEKVDIATDLLSDLIHQGIAQGKIAAKLIDGPNVDELTNRIRGMDDFKDRLIGDISHLRIKDSVDAQLAWRVDKVTQFPPSNITNPVTDPLGTLEEFLTERLPKLGKIKSDGFYFRADSNKPTNVMLIQLEARTPESTKQSTSIRWLSQIKDVVVNEFDVQVFFSGGAIHAAQIKEETKREILWMGFASIVLTLIFFLYIARSLKALLITAISALLSVFGGLVIAYGTLGLPHLIGLTMATTVVGICIDFSFHFWVHVRNGKNGIAAINTIRSSVNMSFVTTSIGLLAISFLAVPVLAKSAIFVCGALFFSWLLVMFIFPILVKNSGISTPINSWHGVVLKRIATVIVLIILCISSVGFLLQYHTDDRPILLGREVENLIQNDRIVEGLFGRKRSSIIYLIQKDSASELLMTEEILLSVLSPSENSQVEAVSKLVVPAARQLENQALFKHARSHLDIASLNEYLSILHVPELDWHSQKDKEYSLEWVIAQPWASIERHHILSCDDAGCASMIRADDAITAKLDAACQDVEGCSRISLSELQAASFQHLRAELAWSVLLAVCAMFMALYVRYRKKTFKLLIVPAMAAISGVGAVVLAGMPVTAFTLAALFPLIGLSVDYAIFTSEGGNHSKQTSLAIFASALTTAGSFAILAASGTAAIQFFAIPVAVGILVAWLSAQILRD